MRTVKCMRCVRFVAAEQKHFNHTHNYTLMNYSTQTSANMTNMHNGAKHSADYMYVANNRMTKWQTVNCWCPIIIFGVLWGLCVCKSCDLLCWCVWCFICITLIWYLTLMYGMQSAISIMSSPQNRFVKIDIKSIHQLTSHTIVVCNIRPIVWNAPFAFRL